MSKRSISKNKKGDRMMNIIALDSSYLQALASNDQNVVLHFKELKKNNPRSIFIIHDHVVWEMFFACYPETSLKPVKLPKNIPERHKAKFKVLEENNFSIFGLPAVVEESLFEQWSFDRFLHNCTSVDWEDALFNMIQINNDFISAGLDWSEVVNSNTFIWFRKRIADNLKWTKGDWFELYNRFISEAVENDGLKKIQSRFSQKEIWDSFIYAWNLDRYNDFKKNNVQDWEDLFENLKGAVSNSTKPQCDDYPLNYDDIKNRLSSSLFPRILDNDMDYIWLGDSKYRVVKKEKQGNSPIRRYTLQPNEEIIHVIPPEEPHYYGNLDKVREDYMPLYMSHLKRAFLGVLKDLEQKYKNVKKQIVNCKIEEERIELNQSFLSDYRIGGYVLPYVQRFITCDRAQAAILKFLFPGWKQKIDFVKKSQKKDSN